MRAPRCGVPGVRLRAAAVSLALLMLAMPAEGQPQRRTVLRIAAGPDAEVLDPRGPRTTSAASIGAYVFDSLLPELAASWSVSADGRTYTVVLRRDVLFHDGTRFDAAAVKANMPWWGKGRAAAYDFSAADPPRIETPSPYTLVVRLPRPDGGFLRALAGAVVLSPRVLSTPYTAGEAGPREAGTGPYRLREWVAGDHVTLVKSPHPWRAEPWFDAIVVRLLPEAGAREALLRDGSVDMAVDLPGTDLAALRGDSHLRVLEAPSAEAVFVTLNTQWGPFRNVLVRQALNYAVNKRAVIRTLLPGLADVLESPLPPLVSGSAPIRRGGWPYDPLLARRLLRRAGYPHGFGVVLGTPLGWYIEDYQVGVAVAKQLENIGVTTPTPGISASDVFVAPTPTYLRWLRSPPTWTPPQLILSGWASSSLDAASAMRALFTRPHWPPDGAAASYYDNPRVDALLSAARLTADPAVRANLYRQAQTLIWNDAPWIFLWSQHAYLAVSRRLHGVVLLPTGRWAAAFARWE